MGLKNVVVMIPFAEQSKSCKSDGGYERIRFSKRRNELELYLMAEIPSNILMAEEFAVHIDGFLLEVMI
jgi:pyruvate,water dikinase